MHSSHPHFQPVERVKNRVETLLSQLTLDEKITLLAGHHKEGMTLAVERLGIPNIKMADGPVGVHWWCEKSTAYPASITLASAWDRNLSYRLGTALGRDCRARGVHILLAPGVNIYRSALCGRNFEYLGEDPVLAGELVQHEIKGVQDQGVSATVKHYALNNQEFDRHACSSDADERTIREVYLPAFEAAICDGGSACIMTGYNLVNGTHCSQHEWLIHTILRKEWGFLGVVMSDWISVHNTEGAINGGLDLEMPTAKLLTAEKVHKALTNGLITEDAITRHTRNLLTLAACFGWLDHEQKDASIPWDDPISSAAALDISRSGMVLLKNEDAFLPLDAAKVKKVVVLGYHAGHPVICGGGSAYTPPYHTTTLVEGLKKVAPSVQIDYFRSVNLDSASKAYVQTEFTSPDGEKGLKAEYFNTQNFSGPVIATQLSHPLHHIWFKGQNLKEAIPNLTYDCFSVSWTGNFVPKQDGCHVFYIQANDGRIRLNLNGKLVADSTGLGFNFQGQIKQDLKAGQPCTIELTYVREDDHDWNQIHLGILYEGDARIDYAAAMKAASNADAVIVSVGYTAASEGEGHDREFGIGEVQEQLILDSVQANPNTVIAMYAGGNVDMQRWVDKVKGLLYLWYPGQDGAQAAAEIFFGQVNPSGKLPATFEKALPDRSSFECYHDDDLDKRTAYDDGIFGGYRHHDRKGHAPRFPFGFGLSYTTFEYKNLQLSKNTLLAHQALDVQIDITNTGNRTGAEIVQIYVRDEKATVLRPVRASKRLNWRPAKPRPSRFISSPGPSNSGIRIASNGWPSRAYSKSSSPPLPRTFA